jgi:hypothetical protein
MHIDFRGGQTKGLAYCFVRAFPDAELKDSLSDKRQVGAVDGEAVFPARAASGPSFVPMWVLERDEFAFHFFRIYLESTRGDV